MITEIIDLLVDASNSFGSLFNSIITKYRNYRSIISNSIELDEQTYSNVIDEIPEIKRELAQSRILNGYVLITKIKTHKEKSTIEFVFLDTAYKCRHVFYLLKQNKSLLNELVIPCYWRIY